MRVHHLNCGTMCPVAARWLLAHPEDPQPHLVCHCLLVETSVGLVLVDTGFGTRDRDPATSTLARDFCAMSGPRLSPEETALAQIRARGFRAEDVRHIILTHLDPDHAGGLVDFPGAKIHVLRAEHDAANNPRSFGERRRYRKQQWEFGADFRLYEAQGEAWKGFDAVRSLDGLPPEFLMVPLRGHTRGHAGVAIDCGHGWLLHAGDAYFYHGEMEQPPQCTSGLSLFQRVMAVDNAQRVLNQSRLRELIKSSGDDVRVFSAHDSCELAKQRALSQP